MPKSIYRWAYMPIFDLETNEYSWNKLKVVKVWLDYHIFGGWTVKYMLENCISFSEYNLITEVEKSKRCPKHAFNYLFIQQLNKYPSVTIFSSFKENKCKGKELDELIKESKNIIDRLKRDDEILGEEEVLELINPVKKKKSK